MTLNFFISFPAGPIILIFKNVIEIISRHLYLCSDIRCNISCVQSYFKINNLDKDKTPFPTRFKRKNRPIILDDRGI